MDDRYERDIVEVARDYARFGLVHRRRDCPFCTCPMLLVRNAESRSQLIWQCGRCGISKGITMNTPLCYIDIKLFDISIFLWIDNVWPRLAQNIVRDRNSVIKNFQLVRKTCSLFVKTRVLPYVKLPGPVEIDETRLGRQKLSKCTVFARKINRVFGMYCRSSGIPLFYYIPDRKHPTLVKIIRKHLPIGGTVISDTMTSYVRPRSETSRLDPYGFYHFYINITQHNIHEKYSFVYINNVRRNFLELKRHISAYHRMYVPVEKVDQFIHSYMVRTIMKKDRLYEAMLKLLRDYYNYQLDVYLTRYNDEVKHVPNIQTIDKIDKMLDGKHPDAMGDIKHRYRLGLFLAKPKQDPLTKALLQGQLMEKANQLEEIETEKNSFPFMGNLPYSLNKNRKGLKFDGINQILQKRKLVTTLNPNPEVIEVDKFDQPLQQYQQQPQQQYQQQYQHVQPSISQQFEDQIMEKVQQMNISQANKMIGSAKASNFVENKLLEMRQLHGLPLVEYSDMSTSNNQAVENMNNLFNEASSFNCHSIEKANLSQLSQPPMIPTDNDSMV